MGTLMFDPDSAASYFGSSRIASKLFDLLYENSSGSIVENEKLCWTWLSTQTSRSGATLTWRWTSPARSHLSGATRRSNYNYDYSYNDKQ